MRGGFYRPAFVHRPSRSDPRQADRVAAVIGASIIAGPFFERSWSRRFDATSTEGVADFPSQDLPDNRVGLHSPSPAFGAVVALGSATAHSVRDGGLSTNGHAAGRTRWNPARPARNHPRHLGVNLGADKTDGAEQWKGRAAAWPCTIRWPLDRPGEEGRGNTPSKCSAWSARRLRHRGNRRYPRRAEDGYRLGSGATCKANITFFKEGVGRNPTITTTVLRMSERPAVEVHIVASNENRWRRASPAPRRSHGGGQSLSP